MERGVLADGCLGQAGRSLAGRHPAEQQPRKSVDKIILPILAQSKVVSYLMCIISKNQTSQIAMNHGHLHLISKIAAETGVISWAILFSVGLIFIYLISSIGELADSSGIWFSFPLVAIAIINERVIEG